MTLKNKSLKIWPILNSGSAFVLRQVCRYYTINPFGNNEIKLDEDKLFEKEGMPEVLDYKGVLAVSSEPEI
jgi:hypothetical protein